MHSKYQEQLEEDNQISEDGCVVCPYCFYEDYDAFEYNLGDGENRLDYCPNCNKMLIIECRITVTFISSKA